MVSLALTGCVNWADAPFMERTGELSVETQTNLASEYPEAVLVGSVYRLHMEDGRRGYTVASTQFLFKGSDGQTLHGTIDASGKLTAHRAAIVAALPEILALKLIREPGAPLAGATLVRKPWTFFQSGRQVHQFEFSVGGRSGLCTTDFDGTNRQVYFFLATTQ